jgi:hypothetical protein
MKRLPVCLLGFCLSVTAVADPRTHDPDDPDAVRWQEEAIQLPPFPEEKNLREFYVSEMTSHRFFIDEVSLQPGKDGVVRYVLVVRTRGGATNITYEGMHCGSQEFKLYASGRQDQTWGEVRKSAWRPIENKPLNRYHAALSRDLFCPARAPILTPEEGRDALRRGKHPDAL